MGDGGAVVYADIFFLVNFSMDFAALLSVGLILSGKLSLPRLALAASVGGVYALLSLLAPGDRLFSLAIDFGVGFFLCFLAFGYRSLRRFLASGALFFGVSLLIGGAVTALYGFLTSRGLLPSASGGAVLLPTAFLTACGALLLARLFRIETSRRFFPLTLFLPGGRAKIEGLLDTGHLAREPLGGRPAVILSERAAAKLLPPPLLSAFQRGDRAAAREDGLPEEYLKLFRLLPVRTLGGEGMLPALLGEAEDEEGRRTPVCIAFALRGEASFGGAKAGPFGGAEAGPFGGAKAGPFGGAEALYSACLAGRGRGKAKAKKRNSSDSKIP